MRFAAAPLVLSGQKSELRTFVEGDITANYLSWLNDQFTMRHSNQRFLVHDRRSSLRYLDSFKGTPNLFFSLFNSQTGLAIGTMTAYVAPHHGIADMGILIGARDSWGQGFGFDAWSTLLEWLSEERKIRKVTAGTLACNAPMLKLIHKSGMEEDGIKKHHEIVDGQPEDVLYFARFKSA